MYDGWGNCSVSVIDSTATTIANLNPFRYRSYYYDTETNLYFLKTRYYDPEIGRFMTIDGISYLDPDSINGLNLYAYCFNNPIAYSDETGCSATITTGALLLLLLLCVGTILLSPSDPLGFSVGLVTPENYEMPEWLSVYVFYVSGSIGWSYTFDEGYSFGSLSFGIIDTTFHTPKWFNALPDDHWANPNIYFGIGAFNANFSVGLGVSAAVEIVSGTIGIQFGDAFTLSAKAYLGLGITVDFSNGIKIGGALGFGFEISIGFDWGEILY